MNTSLLNALAQWSRDTWIGEFGRELYWFFPAAEIVHFIGLCLLFGSLLIIDLRLIGFAQQIAVKKVLQLAPLALLGVLLNIVSGVVFVCTYPENYWPSTAFQIKMGLVFLGCANALWFKFKETPIIENLSDDRVVPLASRWGAAISLSVWTLVIVIGRFLPFVSVSTS